MHETVAPDGDLVARVNCCTIFGNCAYLGETGVVALCAHCMGTVCCADFMKPS